MNYKKKLIIVSNEKISIFENKFYCDNIDMKSIPEGLNENFEVLLISKKSEITRSHVINAKNIKPASNIFNFLLGIFRTLKDKKNIYLLISITPYTFFAYLLLFFFGRKNYVYLRSNGFEEYKSILGVIGPFIYSIMFSIVTKKSKIITCQKRLTMKKSELVFPSELDENWLTNPTKPSLDKPRLLYVGRSRVEKGIFSLLKIFEKISTDVELSVVGKKERLKEYSDKIKFIGFVNNALSLINIYDNHNILILPSFTEAHPKVLDESLARLRPVIIFEEISHIIQNRKGIFVSKRNVQSLSKTIKFVISNYLNIQEDMKKNKLPTKREFFSQMVKILG